MLVHATSLGGGRHRWRAPFVDMAPRGLLMFSNLSQAVPANLRQKLRAIQRRVLGKNPARGAGSQPVAGAAAVVQSALSELNWSASQIPAARLSEVGESDWISAARFIHEVVERTSHQQPSRLNRIEVWQALAYCYRVAGQLEAANAAVVEGMRWVRQPQKLLRRHAFDVQAVQSWLHALQIIEQNVGQLSSHQARETLRRLTRSFQTDFKRKTPANELTRIRGARRLESLYQALDLPDRPTDLLMRIQLAEFYSGNDVAVDLAHRFSRCASGKHHKANATIGMVLHRLGHESEAYRYLAGVPPKRLGKGAKRALGELERQGLLQSAQTELRRSFDRDPVDCDQKSHNQAFSHALKLAQPHLAGASFDRTIKALDGISEERAPSAMPEPSAVAKTTRSPELPVFCAGFRWSGGSAVFDYLSDYNGVAKFWKKPRLFQDSDCSIDTLRDACQRRPADLQRLIRDFVACHVLGVDVNARGMKELKQTHARSLLTQISFSDDLEALDASLARFVGAIMTVAERGPARKAFPVEEFSSFFSLLMRMSSDGESRHLLFDSVIRAPDSDLLELVPGSRMVAAIRDPRDMYVTHVERGGWTRGVDEYIRALGESLEQFNRVRKRLEGQVYLVQFEHFVNDPSERLRLVDWLGIDRSKLDAEPSRRFVAEQSRQNIGVHRVFSDQNAILEIERSFPDLCYELSHSATEDHIRVCTFSAMATRRQQDGGMRMCGRPGDPGWRQRREITANLIADNRYDFVGLQHCHTDNDQSLDAAGWFQDRLREKGLDYGVINRAHGERPDRGDSTPLYYRMDRWLLDPADSGAVYYKTPAPPASEPGGGGRLFVFGRFVDKEGGGRSVYVYNIRLRDQHTRRNDRYRAACIRELLDHIASRKESRAPVIVLGDTNCKRVGTEADKLLLGELTTREANGALHTLADAYLSVHPGSHGKVTTQHNFVEPGKITGSERNDRILYAGMLTVRSAEILTVNDAGNFPSYHYPVAAEFAW